MRSLYLVVGLTLVFNLTSNAQTNGDYQSRQSGNWNTATTWQVFNGGWADLETAGAGAFQNVIPSSASGIITLRDQTTVTIPNGASITADQIEYENAFTGTSGVLTVAAGGTLTIANGSGDDVRLLNDFVSLGLLEVAGTLNLNTGATIVEDDYAGSVMVVSSDTYKILNGGTHVHTTGAGVAPIPSADYQDGSTLKVVATSSPAPTMDTGIQFYDFLWDGSNQSATMTLGGLLRTVRHDLTISNTGSTPTGNILQLGTVPATAYTLNVSHNFSITGNSRVQFGTTASNTINVTGNLNISSTNTQTNAISANATGTATVLNITGDFSKSGASTFNLLIGTTASTATTINLQGNYSHTGGTITRSNSSNGTTTINFTGSNTRTFTNSGGTVSNAVNYNIAIGKTLDMGTSAITGSGTFTLRAGATMRVGSPDGLAIASTALGNIRTTGTRTYFANSNIIYNGSVAQDLGNEWSSVDGGALVGIAVNLEINNASVGGVTNNVGGSTNVVGNLTLTNGVLKIGNSNTLNIQSNFTATSGTIGGLPSSRLVFTGSGTLTGNLTFANGFQDLEILQVDRATDVTLGSALTIASTGSLIFTQPGNLRINGQTLTVNGDITQSGAGGIYSAVATSNLVIGGSGALSSIPLANPIVLNNVTLSRGGATYNWGGNSTINGTLDLTSGTFNHTSGLTMATGSTFQRSAGTTYTGSTPNATTRYSVSYIGTVSTSNELPTTALNRLENLTTAGNVTLDKAIIINGNVNINSGTLTAGAHDITMLGATFAINGGQFSINSGNTVTFSRSSGTTALSGSTINDAQFGNVSIASTTTVSAPNANINVSGLWDNQGTFTPNTGTVTFNGAAQNINANGQPFYNFSTGGSATKTLTGALDVNGTLEIGSGTTLFADTYTINVAGIWDNGNGGTFNAGTGTVTFDGTTQSINNSGQAFNNLTLATTSSTKNLAAALDVNGNLVINTGVTLDITASNYGVNVARTFTNNGTFNPRSGVVVFDGGNNQTINGTTNTVFNDITINKTNNSSAIFGSDQSIAGVLTLTDGVFNPNAHFTMLSSATRDARIAQLGATASIAPTNLTVQRYLPNTTGGQEYRYLASPVTNGTVAGWKDDFPITGTFTDPSTKPEWPQFPNLDVTFPTLYRYNEAMAGVIAIDSRYESYPLNGTASTAATLTNGRGYTAYIRQTTPITIELVGVAASGNVPIVISNKGNAGAFGTANDGWNLIGNPYPSPIHWNNVTRPAGVQTQIAFRDNTDNIGLGAGQYLYYTQGGAGIPGVFDGTIAAGQAFWVRNTASGTSPTLTFQEDDKQPVNSPPFIREAIQDMLRVNVASSSSADELLIGFNQNALDGADVDFDAYKLKNIHINFSSVSTDDKEMAINILGALTCSKEIPLHLNTVTAGGHVFTFSQIESFSENIEIRLLDTFTSQTTNITKENNIYQFQVTTDPNSFGNNRFKIFIGYPTVDVAVGVQAMNVCQGNDASIKIQTPQAGVVYYATLNGNTISDEIVGTSAADLTISIPKANLTSDENHIVLMARSAGCTAVPLNSGATISIENIPALSGVTGDARCGEGQLTLKAAGAPANGGYNWYLTEDATDAIAGESASSFVTPVLTKTKTYFVAAVNSLGCEGSRTAVTATITYPYDIVGVTGAEGCVGSSMSLSASGAPDDGSYRWYVTQGGSEPIPNQSGATFTTPELTASTTYYVAAVNAAGCEGGRVPVTATINILEDPTITATGNTLTSSAASGNQWYLNGTAIPGATAKTYEASVSGVYKLVVTSGSCSTQVEQEFAVTGDIDDGLKGYVLYPNPSAGMIYVEVATPDAVTVSVKNTLGSEIAGAELKQDGEIKKGQLDISGHANGMYLVVIKHGEKTVIRKIVKN